MHCTWLGCIRSCIKDLSHRFLANRWFVHNQFVGLYNLLEVVVHYLLIEGMVSLNHWNDFPMVSTLVCIITHWTRLMVSHDVRLSSSYDFTKPFHYVISQSWENTKLVPKLVVTLTYGWGPKVIIYYLWVGLLLIEVSSNRYSQ